MIGKIITKRADAGDPHNLMAYLVFGTGKDREKREPRFSSITFLNTHCQNWKDFAHDCQTRRDAADGRDNIYHFVLSVQEKDKDATDQQLIEASKIALRELGLDEHAAAAVVHRDTDNPHLHVALDLVHPETYRRKARPSHDFAKLAKACRLAEHQLGFSEDRGHWAGDAAAARSLGQADPAKPDRASRKNRTRQGDAHAMSFQARIDGNQALKSIFAGAKSWTDLQTRLSAFGQSEFGSSLSYIRYGSGAILALADDPQARGKASLVHSSCSLSKLEKRFGPIPPPRQAAAAAAPTRATGPTKPADKLWTQYQALKASHKTDRAGTDRLRKALTDRQKAESDQLRAAHRQERRFLHAQFFWTHSDRLKADSARAHAAATRREALEIRHKLERQALSKLSRFPSWREWLTEQATNDPAAADRLARVRPEAAKAAPTSTTSTLSDLKAEADKKTGFTTYRDQSGRLRVQDEGKHIMVARSATSSPAEREAGILAALPLSIEKYGVNGVNITGNRAEVIRIAGRNGVWVGNLNAAEKLQWQAFRAASFSSSRARHARTPDPSATADHARRTRHARQQETHNDPRTHLPDLHLQQDKTLYNAR